MLRLVIIESPFAPQQLPDRWVSTEEHIAYLRRCIFHSIRYKGEAPFASHGFYTQYLDDTISSERELGMRFGQLWMQAAADFKPRSNPMMQAAQKPFALLAVYTDYGLTHGMKAGIRQASRLGLEIEFREIGRNGIELFTPEEHKQLDDFAFRVCADLPVTAEETDRYLALKQKRDGPPPPKNSRDG